MKKGNIGVTTENIFPVIKKFLYSDHEIFLREMVSNAVDATQKIKTLAENGEYKGDLGDLTVRISINPEAATITVSDHGIGMTEEEIEKYINQIAFSGVNDFLEKYKDNAHNIIGHFGLGFYSAFMVSKKVEIITRNYKEGSKAVKWTCDGSPEYEISEVEKSDRGSDIVLYIDDDCKEYLEKYTIQELLGKYCKFMPVPVAFGKKTQWKDGKQEDTDEDNIINDVEPLWTKTPSTLTDEDYKQFYRTLYPMQDEPMFWIHLNVDYPFNLTGILYFPKIKSNIDLQRNKIQLYCNQVFVTDQVEGIVPDFLTLLHGVIDSPDIPLNVSRSYLQSDKDVKKISTYITKKVSDRLQNLFKEDRKGYEEKWNDLKLFINYGMLTEETFYDRAKDFALLTDTEGHYFTYEEYHTLIKDSQTDKDRQLVYLYATDKEEQYTHIEEAKAKGYSVLLLDGQLDVSVISMLEQKMEKTTFARVDSNTPGKLIRKEEPQDTTLSEEDKKQIESIFSTESMKMDGKTFHIEPQGAGETAQPLTIIQDEYMRRMKDISRYQPGMGYFSQMPDSYTMVVNTAHPLIKQILAESKAGTLNAHSTSIIEQLADLALLQNGMLKAAALDKFVKRSQGLIMHNS